VFRATLSPSLTFRDLLLRTRKSASEAYEHQHLPFEELVNHLQPDRTATGTRFFQVAVNYRDRSPVVMETNDLKIEPLASPLTVAVDDLRLDVSEKPDGLLCLLQYNTDIFDPETIKRIGDHFQMLLAAVVNDPDESVSRALILPPAERQQTVVEWNRTQQDFTQPHCLHHLFEEQVVRTPGAEG
jgi:non-ribosomal peptide synthetase component F